MEWSIGNGQTGQIGLSEVARTLDCMKDTQKVMIGGGMSNDLPEQAKGGDVQMGVSTVRRLTPL